MINDPSELTAEEFHPAARSAYRWLKGFMMSNPQEYSEYRLMIEMAAAKGNRQAMVCLGTIERLKTAQPVSDRYLMGLAWTLLHIHNHEAMEAIADKRIDRAYPRTEAEL